MDNPYQPPTSATRRSSIAQISAMGPRAWGDLALRLVILAFCSFQFLSLSHVAIKEWATLSDVLASGMISPLSLAASFVFAFTLMMAAVLLLFSRKAAVWAFLAYIPYQLYGLTQTSDRVATILAMTSFLSIVAFVLYCLSLKRAGKLR